MWDFILRIWVIATRFSVVASVGIIATLLAFPNVERMGDRLQYALPIAALVCARDINDVKNATIRFGTGLATVHAFKNALPDEGLNARPSGGGNGFPSGHTYAATFGASYIIHQCSEKIPYVGYGAALLAGFTATSRVEAEKHTSIQTFFGALFALLFERGFRSQSLREWFNSLRLRSRKKSVDKTNDLPQTPVETKNEKLEK